MDGKTKPNTFVIQILYRENATWQGTVKWVDGKKELRFRSAMELIKIMEEAMTSEEDAGAK